MNIDTIVKDTEAGMKDSIEHLQKSFNNIRAGRANPTMVSSVMVDYYGNPTPLAQVANVSAPDAMTLNIQPWESSMIQPIEKAIMEANLGFNPSNNGNSVIINVPPLTEERRKELVKMAKSEVENAKISIRTWRKDANTAIKNADLSEDVKSNMESDIQALTDKFVKSADDHFSAKEADIMKV